MWPEVLYVIVNFSPVSVYWFGLYHGLSAARPGSLLEVPVLPVPVSGLAGHFSPMSLVAPLPLDGHSAGGPTTFGLRGDFWLFPLSAVMFGMASSSGRGGVDGRTLRTAGSARLRTVSVSLRG